MIIAVLDMVTPTPGALQDGDLFKAPVPNEFFDLKPYAESLQEPTFTEQVMAWLPVLTGIAAGFGLGVVATLIIVRIRRRRSPVRAS